MRIAKATIIAAAIVLLIPALASATRLTDLDTNGDCIGWSADVTIRFASTIYAVDAELTISLTDIDGNVLETQTVTGVLSRDEGSYQTQLYSFDGEWDYYGPAGDYFVESSIYISWTSPIYGFNEDEKSERVKFECDVVPNEAHNWSSVKGIFR